MPTVGLLYDVHGNLPALEAVLADAATLPVQEWIVGGDVALFGPWPAETLARLREIPAARWLRGNGERWTAAPDEAPGDETVQGAIAAARDVLGPDEVAHLAALPQSVAIDAHTTAWHGSPVSDVRSFLPEPADDEPELLSGVSDDRLIFGHTHLPFRRMSGFVSLINPGSVGIPLDGDPRAAWAVLRSDGTVVHRRAGYDHAASAAAVRDRFEGGWTDEIARRIDRARLG